MVKETKGNSTAAEQYLDHLFKVVRNNEEFLRNNAKETYGEAIGLVNDAIDLVGFIVERVESAEEATKRSMAFFTFHVLMPCSCAIYMDALTGNLPACFMELRLILESLVKCYLADAKYSNRDLFQERLELLEEVSKKEISVSKRMKELGKQLGLGKDFVALWGKLSHDWVHTGGIVGKVVDRLTEKSGVPSWALIIPMSYAEDDLEGLDELRRRISQFRNLLKTTRERYQQELGLEQA